MKFVFEHDAKGYRWLLLAKNGHELARSIDYTSKRLCVKMYQRIIGEIKSDVAVVDYNVKER